MADDGQVLVNLGLIHRDNEVHPVLGRAGSAGCARKAGGASPGTSGTRGRACPATGRAASPRASSSSSTSTAQSRKPNKIVPCKHAGQESHLRADGSSTAMRSKDGEVGGWTHAGPADAGHPDSRLGDPRDAPQGQDRPGHRPPGRVPGGAAGVRDRGLHGRGRHRVRALRRQRHDDAGRRSAPVASAARVEIAPEYVDVAIKRFQQNHPGVPVTLLATGQSFDEVASERLATTEAAQ